MEKLLSKLEVQKIVGVSAVTLWEWQRRGQFPLARRLQPNSQYGKCAWLESEIEEWIKSREPITYKEPKSDPKPPKRKEGRER